MLLFFFAKETAVKRITATWNHIPDDIRTIETVFANLENAYKDISI